MVVLLTCRSNRKVEDVFPEIIYVTHFDNGQSIEDLEDRFFSVIQNCSGKNPGSFLYFFFPWDRFSARKRKKLLEENGIPCISVFEFFDWSIFGGHIYKEWVGREKNFIEKIKLTFNPDYLISTAVICAFCKSNCRLDKTKYIFCTWEGHLWEKRVTNFIRENFKNVTVVGCNFPGIYTNLVEIFSRDNFLNNPHHMIFFNKSNTSVSKYLVVRGTKIWVSKTFKKKVVGRGDDFLILPTGFLKEVLLSIKLAFRVANGITQRVTVRIHPRFNLLIAFLRILFNWNDRVFISDKTSLEDDLSSAKDVVIASSSCLNSYHHNGERRIGVMFDSALGEFSCSDTTLGHFVYTFDSTALAFHPFSPVETGSVSVDEVDLEFLTESLEGRVTMNN